DPEPETQELIAEIRDGRSVEAGTTRDPAVRPPPEAAAPAVGEAEPQPQQDAASKRRRNTSIAPIPLRWALAGGLVVGAGLLVFDYGSPPPPQPNTATSFSAEANQSWTSPVLPGVTADQTWLGAQGLYAVLVLPFSVESADDKAERGIADRLSDDLISDLSRV